MADDVISLKDCPNIDFFMLNPLSIQEQALIVASRDDLLAQEPTYALGEYLRGSSIVFLLIVAQIVRCLGTFELVFRICVPDMTISDRRK